jgi:DNA-binding NarL/FixJ family response regulator
MKTPRKKIIMVDDNIPFRTNLKKYIESDLNCSVIAEASNGREFLEIPSIYLADVILMDIAMEEMDGIEATKKALWKHPNLKIIAITMHSEKIYLIQLIEAGFRGCVFKPDIYNQLALAMDTVMKGKIFMSDTIPIERKEKD